MFSNKNKRSKSSKNAEHDPAELLELTRLDLRRSGLKRSDIQKLRLQPLSRDETDDYVGEQRASYKIPYFDVSGKLISYARVRFLENKRGKFSKKEGSFRYSQPFNSSPHVYFPPYINWKKVAKDSATKLLITEGEKKAAIACKLGIPCIALGGVYGFTSQKRLWDLIPELRDITWREREVEICYDADVMMKSEVRQALTALAFTLSQEYSPTSIDFVFLDAETAGPKTGLDDYLKTHGVKGFNELPRQTYRANARIQLLNQKVCYVKQKAQFFDIETQKFFKGLWHVREAFLNEGEELVDAKRAVPVIDLWAKSANRRTVNDVIYLPGAEEVTENNDLNTWRPSKLSKPRKGTPKMWLDIVHHIMRKPEYAEWFLKWLAYPVQHPGTKLLQSMFVYGVKQGTGKTFTVDPVMEYIYGADNFHRIKSSDLTSEFNSYITKTQMAVANEIYISEFTDRRATMSILKDTITSEKQTVNEKFQPKATYYDYCNYYLTSQHFDALVLEKSDRRFAVIEAPDDKLGKDVYKDLDKYIRESGGADHIYHYLLNTVDTSDFDPKGEALLTPWKAQIIRVSKEPVQEFVERLAEDPTSMMMMNGSLPELQLYRAEDLLHLFEHVYPRVRFNYTVNRIGKLLRNEKRLEWRKVRVSGDSPQVVLYAVFDKDGWNARKNRDWAEHYKSSARIFGGRDGAKGHKAR